MKKSLLLCGLLTALVATTISPSRASATPGATTWAPVEMIAAGGTTTPVSYPYFTLAGVTTIAGCANLGVPTGTTKVIFAMTVDDRGKEQMSLIQSALLSGRSVLVNYDTTVTLNGYCQATAVYIK
jgi:hypothetical protein